MTVQRKFRTGGEGNLASYDFYDLATGTGYKTFYLVDVIVGTDTRDYLLVTNAIGGRNGYISESSAYDRDFDVEFQVPIRIEGDIYFQLPYKIANNYELKINFYHVDGSGTETAIGSTIELNAAAGEERIFSGFVNTSLVSFKPGEKFRCTFSTTSAAANNFIFCDPLGRSDLDAVTPKFSQAIVNLPIKIQQ